MKAKDIFKKQGYKQVENSQMNITYKSNDGIIIMFFYLTEEYLVKYIANSKMSDACMIHMKTHNAINKQLEELDWL